MLVSLFFHNTGTPVNSWNSPPTWGGRTFQKLSDLEGGGGGGGGASKNGVGGGGGGGGGSKFFARKGG